MTALCLEGGGVSRSLVNCCGIIGRRQMAVYYPLEQKTPRNILHVISFPLPLPSPKHYVQIILYKKLKNVLKTT